jgi:adenylate cyclase
MAEERVQRRLAAILAADVVGYSRLMGADEVGTLARFKVLRAEVIDPRTAAHGGRTVKTTGDGILVEFASAVDAVQSAIKVQGALTEREADLPEAEQIALRIGINLGDVIVEDDDIFGDGLNVAARLESTADPGGIRISAAVYDQVKTKIEAGFEDLGKHDLKNIAEPVRIYSVGDAPAARSVKAADEAMFQRPVIAVLPFQNMSGDPDQEYFADGLTEDIITALSLWRSFPVIARNSTFVYKGRSVDIQEVGRALGARYVLEGSVRRAGSRVRVTSQLIDTESAHHVWAERLDRELVDVFDLQDELTARIAGTVAPELERAEAERSVRRPPSDMDAWDYVQRGFSFIDELSADGNARAREMFDKALEIDPRYSRALSGLSLSHSRDLLLEFATSREDAVARAIDTAERAVASDQSDSLAHSLLSVANMWPGRLDVVIREGRRAVELNPNNAFAHGILGTALDSAGETVDGIRELELALQLNPQDSQNHVFINTIARAHLISRRYDLAVEWALKSIQSRSDFPHAHHILASALGHLGQVDEAITALQACEKIQPGFVARRGDWRPYRDDADNQHIFDGIRKTGWES